MIYEVDVSTGKIVKRNQTEAELAQESYDQNVFLNIRAEQNAIAQEEISARESAISKLAALGLTEAEVAALVK
jgi:DNA-binding NarL/FixJ family response regulator